MVLETLLLSEGLSFSDSPACPHPPLMKRQQRLSGICCVCVSEAEHLLRPGSFLCSPATAL